MGCQKARDAYADSRLWADDVRAVIKTLNLRSSNPLWMVICPLVILDYIRHYGEDDIRGVNFVGGITKLGAMKQRRY